MKAIILIFTAIFYTCHCYSFKTYFFKQKVDHFSFADSDSFIQRYLVNVDSWDKNGGPIFFYAGNEGDITLFAENTGFMWEIAPEFKAMLVFAEHRYYGHSMPYGNKSFTAPKYSGYLTSEQALADYMELITYMKGSIKGADKSPVIVFGGSYGGMLAAWFRMKYPHIVAGAIAASAPILQFEGLTPCEKFGQVVTADFAEASRDCVEIIRRSWKTIDEVVGKDKGYAWLSEAWQLCRPVKTKKDVTELKEYLTNVWGNLAMVEYPYPASVLAPLPAYPIKTVCNELKNSSVSGQDLLQELFKGLTVYFNFTGSSTCLDYNQSSADNNLGGFGWDIQACTEMVMPFCYDGKKDFFEPSPWNFTSYAENCFKKWGIYPQPFMAPRIYGGKDIKASSNIVFSNGLLDPWSTGGVLWNVSSTVVSVIIPEGAHHLDLRAADPNDPQSVVTARKLEKEHIKRWIKEYKRKHVKQSRQ